MGKRVSILFSLFLIISCTSQKEDSIIQLIYEARIFSFEGNSEREFDAMLIQEDKVLAIGTFDSLVNLYPDASKISMGGNTIYPGFHDAHTHFYAFGKGLNEIDLRSCASWQEIISRVQSYEKANPDKKWLIGRGWDQNLWEDKSFPDRAKLDSLFSDKYVFLKRVDGHAAIANQALLQLAKIDSAKAIEGGLIVSRKGKNEPSGVLVDNAVDLIAPYFEKESFDIIRKNLLSAQKICLQYGITAVTEAGLDLPIIKAIDSLQRSGELKIRVVAMLNPGKDEFEFAEKQGQWITDKLIVRSFKLYADGALGSRGALLKSPYCDNPTNGLALHDSYYFLETCKKIDELNFQACTHCIGDSANRLILDVYGQFLKGDNDKRWRIEHAQVLEPNDIALFNLYKVIPSVQPTHATSDGAWVEDRLCLKRMEGAYAYKSLLAQAGLLALGTDFPVEEVNPINTYLSAVYRTNSSMNSPFRIEEHLSDFETLKGMTYWPAYAAFAEGQYGSIQVGMKADFIVLQMPLKEFKMDVLKEVNPVKQVWLNGVKLIEN